jgi:hypothetical protein
MAAPARAAETPEQELRALGQCAAAYGAYQTFTRPGVWAGATDEDRAREGRATRFEPGLKARADALAKRIGEAGSQTITREAIAEITAVAEAAGDQPVGRRMLDHDRPVIEACITRARKLPA